MVVCMYVVVFVNRPNTFKQQRTNVVSVELWSYLFSSTDLHTATNGVFQYYYDSSCQKSTVEEAR